MNWLDQYANATLVESQSPYIKYKFSQKLYDNEGLLNFQNVTYNKSNLKMS